MGWLIDTNILSELRKGRRADARVLAWADSVRFEPQFISVLSLGEIRKGIEMVRSKDAKQALALEAWMENLKSGYAEAVLPVCSRVADVWGHLQAERTLPVIDGLLAATARVHYLKIATRNTEDFQELGIDVVNPFEGEGSDLC